MGLITNLVRMKQDADLQKAQKEMQAYGLVFKSPDANPEAHEWALENILRVAGLGGGKGGGGDKQGKGEEAKNILKELISKSTGGLVFGNKPQQQQGQQGGQGQQPQQQGQQRPQRLLMTPEEQQDQQKRLDERQQGIDVELRRKMLALSDIDPNSTEAKEFLLRGEKGTKEPGTTASERPVVLKPGESAVSPTTGKTVASLPPAPGKVTPQRRETAQDIHLGAEAARLHKTVDQLTPQEKEAAITKARKVAVQGSTVVSKAASNGYKPGGKSVSNPTGDMSVDIMAWDWIITDHLPFTGMGGGKGGQNKREQALGRAGEILADLNITPAELPALRASIKSNSQALGRITSMGAMTQQFETTVQKNMGLAQHLSQQFARTGSPFVNRLEGGILQQTDNAAVNNFNLQMQTLATEYARVMGGATNAAGTKIGDKEDAVRFINGYLGKRQLDGLFNTMQIDMNNRTEAIQGEKEELVRQIRTGIQSFQGGGSLPSKSVEPKTEGPIAVNPKTGERAQWNGKAWVRINAPAAAK